LRDMRNLGWVAAVVFVLGTTGCVISSTSSSTDSGGNSAHASIDSLSVTPMTVNDGDSFTVTWKVSHTTTVGYFTELGLYLGDGSNLASASSRDSSAFFTFGATQGAPNDPSSSTTTCTRTAQRIDCGTAQSSVEVPAGDTPVTFRACNSYVLDSSSEVCDTQTLTMSFP
jgi:hypothetical protein